VAARAAGARWSRAEHDRRRRPLQARRDSAVPSDVPGSSNRLPRSAAPC